MKILLVLSEEYPGFSAGAKHAQLLARGLAANKVDVTVIGFGGGDQSQGLDEYGVKFRADTSYKLHRGLFAYIHKVLHYRVSIAKIVNECLMVDGGDAVIYHGRSWWGVSLLRGVCKAHGAKLVPFQMEWFPFEWLRFGNGSLIDQWLFRRLTLPNCDGMIGISHFWKTWANQRTLKCVVAPALIGDPIAVSTRTTKEISPFTIVYAGKWARRELIFTILKALKLVITRGVKAKLVVVGNIGTSAIARHAMEMLKRTPELQNSVEFTGWVSEAKLDELFVGADAFVLLRTDSRETDALFPTRLPEYLASGNPVILSRVKEMEYYFEHEDSVLFISPGDHPDELADAICYLQNCPESKRKIGLRGREVCTERFDYKLIGERIQNFIQSLVASGVST